MKQIERLLIQQGHKCFFCGNSIPPGEETVEHLDALSNGGEKTDQNCVACCRAINTALGNLSVKYKLRAILNQPNPFPCPHKVSDENPAADNPGPSSDLVIMAVDMLKRYGDKVPRRKNTFFNAVRVEVPNVTDAELEALFDDLARRRIVAMRGVKVLYPALLSEA